MGTYDLFRKTSLDGAEVAVVLNDDMLPPQLEFTITRGTETISAVVAEDDANELAAVIGQSL